jgi:hypothetical protein
MTRYKIRTILDHLKLKFGEVYAPEESLTTDRIICAFQGHINFPVFLKGKPHK